MCGIGLTLSSRPDDSAVDLQPAESIGISLGSLERRGPDCIRNMSLRVPSGHVLNVAASVLHLRGASCVPQPLQDAEGNVLLWNGEVFGGAVSVPAGASDSRALLCALSSGVGSGRTVCEVLEFVQGPWACVYWHARSRSLWHGRDALGRRSLLRARRCSANGESQLILCSTAVPLKELPWGELAWEELPTDGVGCITLHESGHSTHAWHPRCTAASSSHWASVDQKLWASPAWLSWARREAAAALLRALSSSVRRRVCEVAGGAQPTAAQPRVAVMFSGGIDSMVIARLADLHTPPEQPIELLNVAFGAGAARAPDRLSGLSGWRELERLSERQWRFVEVDISLEELEASRDRLEQLLTPAETVMDLNIGAALWFGSRGYGRRRERPPIETVEPVDLPAQSELGTALENATVGATEAAAVPCKGDARVAAAEKGAVAAGEQPLCRYADAEGEDLAAPVVSVRIQFDPAEEGSVPSVGSVSSVRLSLLWEDEREKAVTGAGGEWAGAGGDAEPVERRTVAACTHEEYTSSARVLLMGMGADEQMGGYGRHRTTFKRSGWAGLQQELEAERERLWLRNLGRDDRMLSDWGREARHPFLDEDVMSLLAVLPLPLICDLEQQLGRGDKMILRSVGRSLGLARSCRLQKRAIQFGTRIANRNVYGKAKLRGDYRLSELVHPAAAGERDAGGAGNVREELSKKRRALGGDQTI